MSQRLLQVIAGKSIALGPPVRLVLFPAHRIRNDRKNLGSGRAALDSGSVYYNTNGPGFDKLIEFIELSSGQLSFNPGRYFA